MALRTIKFWVLYDPKQKDVIASRQFKYEITRLHQPKGSKVIQVKGHYVRSRP